jgi:hypothetical protein
MRPLEHKKNRYRPNLFMMAPYFSEYRVSTTAGRLLPKCLSVRARTKFVLDYHEQIINLSSEVSHMLTSYCATEYEDKSAKDPKRMGLPDYNEVPEYGLEALVSTIDDEKELLAAVRRDGMRYAELMTETTNGVSSTHTRSGTSARRTHLAARN